MRKNVLDSNNSNVPIVFDKGDNGLQSEQMFSKANSESILIKMLESLNDREKIILLYQVMKYFGYDMTQERLAKTLNFSRISYIALWKKVRVKCEKVIKDGDF